MSVCSFIGHRKVESKEEVERRAREVIEDLILHKGVRTFLFGSRSEFDELCHKIVTEWRLRYTEIKRIAYTCKGEGCVLEREREALEAEYRRQTAEEVRFLGMEEEYEHPTKYTAGRASYIQRNQAMMDDSDYCVFLYDEGYRPSKGESGTAIAYAYAERKKKQIFNIAGN